MTENLTRPVTPEEIADAVPIIGAALAPLAEQTDEPHPYMEVAEALEDLAERFRKLAQAGHPTKYLTVDLSFMPGHVGAHADNGRTDWVPIHEYRREDPEATGEPIPAGVDGVPCGRAAHVERNGGELR